VGIIIGGQRVPAIVCVALTGTIVGCGGLSDRDPNGSGASGIDIDPSAGDSDAGESSAADDDDDGADDEGTAGGDTAADSGGLDEGTDEGAKFDLGVPDGGPSHGDTGCDTEDCECTIPDHVPCDADTNDPFQALGLNCAGELQVDDSTSGAAVAIGVRTGFGGNGTFDPREGEKFAVISSGRISELDSETPAFDFGASPTYCNDDVGAYDPGGTLPAPLSANDVGGDCIADPTLVGGGDCSNTIQGQFDQGGAANDYTELRFELDVPPDIVSFSYDFAFFSTEYPYYYGDVFNDMYVGWLESEAWTGNISFDASGNPISLNAGFLAYQDDAANLPEFDGTCMKSHAGTEWLTTTAGVAPGEHITVVFAIFDLADSILDSYAFVDNFEWGCDPTGMPQTEPEG
jgi:hypothetical protein